MICLQARQIEDSINEVLMEEIRSGKELCDNFFEGLLKKEDIDEQLANRIRDLYINRNFTKEKILQALQLLREDKENKQ